MSPKNFLAVGIARERSKTLKKEKEKQKMRKSQTTVFLLLLFYLGKFIFCETTYLEKLKLYCYICITVFSRGRLLEMQQHQRPFRYSLVLQTSCFDPKTWQQIWYFNVDCDSNGLLLLFIYFRKVPSVQEKKVY